MESKDRMSGGYETMVSDKEDVVIDTGKQGMGGAAKEKLASTARTLREQGADKIASSATTLLKKGENYLEGADLSPVRADVERMIRQYPIPALVAGVFAGYLMAHRGALKALGFGLGVGYLISRTRPR
jgi:hypothetical protein